MTYTRFRFIRWILRFCLNTLIAFSVYVFKIFWYSSGRIQPCSSMAIVKIQSDHIHISVFFVYCNCGCWHYFKKYFVHVMFSGFLYIYIVCTITHPNISGMRLFVIKGICEYGKASLDIIGYFGFWYRRFPFDLSRHIYRKCYPQKNWDSSIIIDSIMLHTTTIILGKVWKGFPVISNVFQCFQVFPRKINTANN